MHQITDLLFLNELLFCYVVPHCYGELVLGHLYLMSYLFM